MNKHSIELKYKIPTCNILGVNIAATNMKFLLNFLSENIDNLKGNYICVSNVHTTIMSYENDKYCSIQNNAVLAIPDGGPLSSLGRKRGFSEMERTTGPEFMEKIFIISAKKGYKHYFYGCSQDTLDKLKNILETKYQGVQIVGMYSPPFRDLSNREDEEITKIINATEPDFVWIGLGAPKQEIWMSKHRNKINGLMVGVGAGFDYLAENISRAPKWMQKNNLEWLYRLKQDPKRLLKRYLVTNTKFIWIAIIRGK